MQPKIRLLTEEMVQRVLEEAFELMMRPGIRVQSAEARQLLRASGAEVDENEEVARIPERMAREALKTAPAQFSLYDRSGNTAVNYGGDDVHFDPGSSGVHILDSETLEHRPSSAADLVKIVKLTEMLPQYAAQSTAVVCNEVPKAIGDLYRLFLVLRYSDKPIVTGSILDSDAADDDRHAGNLRRWAGGSEDKTAGCVRCMPIAAVDLE